MTDMACEKHPTKQWPHDECVGPGMPWYAAVKILQAALAASQQRVEELEADHQRMMLELADKIQAGLTVVEFNAQLKERLDKSEQRVEELERIAKAARRWSNAHSDAALAVKDGPEYRAACVELFELLETYESKGH